MNYSSFKQQVIKSGIPLEKTISEYLFSLGLLDMGEYIYEREGQLFSIDAHAITQGDFNIGKRNNLINIDLLVECKYKEPNHSWVFASYQKSKKSFSLRLQPNVVFLDFPFEKRLKKYGFTLQKRKKGFDEIYYKKYNGLYFPYTTPLVNVGTEIIDDKKFNPHIITEAISQIVYGVGSSIVDNSLDLLEEELFDYTREGDKFYVFGWLGCIIYPIIVTTANLYLIKPKQTIDDIKRSQNIQESFEEIDAVLFCHRSNKELQKYTKDQFEKHKKELLDSPFFRKKTFENEIDDLSYFNVPILIVRLPAFKKYVRRILNEINIYLQKVLKYCKELK